MAHVHPRHPGAAPLHEPLEACLGRTCLQWSPDGELAEPDATLVLARLRAADASLAALLDRGGDAQEPPID